MEFGEESRLYSSLWHPHRPTIAYIGKVAIGLAVVEMSELVEVRHVDGKYVREDEFMSLKLPRHYVERSWKTTKEFHTVRLRLLAYSPDHRVKWSETWQETPKAPLQSILKSIVKSIVGAANVLVHKKEEADRKDELERLEQLTAEEGRKREEDKRRAQQSVKDSQEHLGQIIQQWSNVMNVERFLAGVEQRVADLPGTERNAVLERLNLARRFLGTRDPLDFLRSWKTPDERYRRVYSDEQPQPE